MSDRQTAPHVDAGAVVSRDPEIHSGDLVFAGTRVPVETLIDYLKGGQTIDEFLAGFPTVSRRQVEAFLDLATDGVAYGGTRDSRRL